MNSLKKNYGGPQPTRCFPVRTPMTITYFNIIIL